MIVRGIEGASKAPTREGTKQTVAKTILAERTVVMRPETNASVNTNVLLTIVMIVLERTTSPNKFPSREAAILHENPPAQTSSLRASCLVDPKRIQCLLQLPEVYYL